MKNVAKSCFLQYLIAISWDIYNKVDLSNWVIMVDKQSPYSSLGYRHTHTSIFPQRKMVFFLGGICGNHVCESVLTVIRGVHVADENQIKSYKVKDHTK